MGAAFGSTAGAVEATSFTDAVETLCDAFGAEVGSVAAVAFGVGSADGAVGADELVRVGVTRGAAVVATFAIVITTGGGGSVSAGGANAVGAALGVDSRSVAVGDASAVWTSSRGVASVLGGMGEGVAGGLTVVTVAAGPGGDGFPAALMTADAPAGTVTAVPPALVSTLPAVATTVVSPPGKTATYELDPARMTEAMAALCTSYRLPEATVLATAYQTRPRVCCMRTT